MTVANTQVLHGVQSVGVSTNFNLEQVFELGKLALYENIEEIPDVEISITKVLDGYALAFHRATLASQGTAVESPSLIARSNVSCDAGIGIFADTDTATSEETSVASMYCSGMFVSSVSYNFPLDGNFTEDVTLVGNNKAWQHAPNYGNTLNSNFDSYNDTLTSARGFGETDAPTGSGSINRRQDLIFGFLTSAAQDSNNAVDASDTTVLPPEVFGVTNSGTNEQDSDGTFGAHLSSITVSANLGRESINELGRKAPYHRFVSFPIEVTTEIEATSHSGDMVSAIEEGIYNTGAGQCDLGGNLKDRTIRIATCEGTRIYCGLKNRLSSVNYTGGDTGGGNVTTSWSFTTFNDMTVMHVNDPHASGSVWWAARATYLTENG